MIGPAPRQNVAGGPCGQGEALRARRTSRPAVPDVSEAIAIATTKLIAAVATLVDSAADVANGCRVTATIARPMIHLK